MKAWYLIILSSIYNPLEFFVRASEIIDISNDNPPQNPSLYGIDTLASPSSLFPLGGTLPLERVHHTIKASTFYLFVYGGYGNNGTYLGDMNLYHLPSQTWSNPIIRYECCNQDDIVIETIGTDISINIPNIRPGFEGDFPLPRAEHDACVINEQMYLFGGVTKEYGLMNDLYIFNPLELRWNQLDMVVGSEVPSRRAGHVLIADTINNQCYLFGGRKAGNSNNNQFIGLYDMWSFNTLTTTWTRIDTPNVNSITHPFGRQYTAATIMNGNFYIFGGMDPLSGVYYQDLWVFSINNQYWQQILPSNPSAVHQYSPPPLAHAHLFPSLCTTEGNSQQCEGLLIYSGIGSGGFCGTSLCNAKQLVFGQLYLYSFVTQSWIEPFFDTNNANIPSTTQSNWLYARLSSAPFLSTNNNNNNVPDNQQFNNNHRNEAGKYIKTYGMEKIVFIPKKSIFYEYGGIQAINNTVMTNNQQNTLFVINDSNHHQAAVNTIMPMKVDVGGLLLSDFSDVETGEQLRIQLDLPSNQYWDYQDAWTASPSIAYLRTLRKFTVADRDIVLVQEDNYNINDIPLL